MSEQTEIEAVATELRTLADAHGNSGNLAMVAPDRLRRWADRLSSSSGLAGEQITPEEATALLALLESKLTIDSPPVQRGEASVRPKLRRLAALQPGQNNRCCHP